jgi:hypothetical protein
MRGKLDPALARCRVGAEKEVLIVNDPARRIEHLNTARGKLPFRFARVALHLEAVSTAIYEERTDTGYETGSIGRRQSRKR